MKVNWKTVAATVAIVFAGTAAFAEHYVLHSHKYWSVSFVDYEGSNWCNAQASLKNGTSVSINANPDRSVQMQVFVPNKSWKDSYARFSFQIDNRTPWTANDANYFQQSIFVNNLKSEVIRQIAEGREIHLYNYRDEYVTSLSLAGSKAAMYALADCQNKLGPATRAQF